jgi:hypothetical protein
MCDKAQLDEDKHYYYRWSTTNILVIGCEAHVKEIFDVLNTYQQNKNN